LNYSGKFDAKLPFDGPGAPHHPHIHVDSVSAHGAPVGAIVVPDAQLLFNGDFKRSGVDLILSRDDRELVLQDYFKGEKRAALSSPDGAHLTGDIIDALTGHQQFAQADGSASAGKVIGHLTKLIGTATAIRNGVSIILNNGDNVEKGDVVQSGSGSTVGITFIDGTVFGLSSNARMVLNEMVYDPNGSNNSSLLSLVAGTISFVAGETAKHGDMKVDTPVATMGIRGTAVLVEIDFDIAGQGGTPAAKFQVLVEPDGTTGRYVLFDKVTLAPIATVDQAGVVKSLSQGILTSYSAPLSADVQKLITDVFALKFTDNTNTKTLNHQFTDSIVPQSFQQFKLADGSTAIPIFVNVPTPNATTASGPGGPGDPLSHIPGSPLVAAFGGALIETIGVTHSSTIDTVTGKINFVDINAGDTPTVTTKFSSFTFQDAQHNDVTKTLNAQQLADIAAVQANLILVPDPANKNTGSVTWTYSVVDSAFDFISAGETLTLTYIARVDNNFAPNNETGFQSFTITITRGTNDVPDFTTGPQAVAFSGGTSTIGGDLTPNGPTSGTLSFTDVDLTDTHTVSAQLTGAVLSSGVVPPGPLATFQTALAASLATDSTGTGNGAIHWSLADLPVFLADFIPAGEILTLTYTVTVTDSQNTSSSQTITVTITGTDAPAVVWIATTTQGSPPGGLWSDASNWETGTVPIASDDVIIITDQLHGLTPSFPVTINAPAFASSLTMNDFGATAPQLINHSTLTISGVLSLNADSVVDNSGTISVGGLMEVLDHSVLHNYDTLKLAQGGDFKDYSTISNSSTGKIEVTGGILNVQVDVANSGLVTVGSGATLKLNHGTITGGTVTNKANGIIDLAGEAVLKNGALGNSGQIKVSGTGNALHNETVTNLGAGLIAVTGALTLDLGTSIAGGILTNSGTVKIETASGATLHGVSVENALGTIAVDSAALAYTGKLVVDGGTTIAGGTVTIGSLGIFEVATALGATLDGVSVGNSGVIQIDAGSKLDLDGTTITGGIVTDNGTIHVTGHSAINGAAVNGGHITVDAGKTLTLDNTTVTGTTVADNGTVKVDANKTLNLSDVELSGGAVTVETAALIKTGGSVTLTTDVTNDGTIEVHDGALKISGSVAGSGSVKIDSGALFELDGTDTQDIVFAGAGGELQIDGSSFGGRIVSLEATDELDLRSIGYGASTTGTYVSNANNTGGVLTITDGIHSISMTLVGDYRHAHFAGTTDGHSGTLITLNAIDDAPAFVPAEEVQTGVVTELSNTTGSSVHDPLPPIGGTIHFSDIDLTDRPTATITAQSVTWTAADHTDLSSSLTQLELDALEHALSLIQTSNTNNGAIGWSYSITDSSLDFLAAGQTAKIVSTVTLNDQEGGTDTATVTITITGANDTPAITSGAQTGAITECTDVLNSTVEDKAYGTVKFTDADLSDTHTVTVTGVTTSGITSGLPSSSATLKNWLSLGPLTDSGNGATGSDAWTFAAQDKNFDYLAAGETVKLTYTVEVADNHGGTTTQNVDITITGANDAPVITSSAQTGAITECEGTLNSTSEDTACGTVTFTDADLSDTHTVTVTGVTASGVTSGLPSSSATLKSWLSLETMTDSGNGAAGSDAWTFAAQDKNFDYLRAGQTVTLTYTVEVADNHGGTTTQNIDVTITGTNDAPIILSETNPLKQTVVTLSPATPIVLGPGVNTNALGLPTETFDSLPHGSPSTNGLGFGDFISATLGATFSGSAHAGVVNGSSASVSAAPFVGPGVADTTNYLSIGTGGKETITFAHEQNAFGLYWGSVDSFNKISFYHGATLVASYTGADVTPLFPTGNQGSFSSNGYVEFAGLASFDKVVLTSGSNAFEVDNISAGTVPAPHVELAAPITGTLSVSDADIGDTLTASVIGEAVITYNGSTTLPANVNVDVLKAASAVTFDSVQTNGGVNVLHWTYDPSNPDLDFLKAGDTLTIGFTAQVNDDHGNVGNKALTITIGGADPSANMSEFTVVNGTSQNDTFNHVGNNVTIFGAGGHDTFVFNAHFGSATIGDFDVNNDMINIDHSLFATVEAFVAAAHQVGLDTIITNDPAHDAITLKGVTLAQLQAHQSDFHVI
jgi:fibronectin-binding autotransporter adhesin